MRNQIGKLVVLGTILSMSVGPVLAQGRGNAGASGGMSAGSAVRSPAGNANIGGQSGVNGQLGGPPSAAMGSQARANANGPNAADRDLGSDRAADRAAVGSRADSDASASDRSASELGSLNASHASETARENASSNSAVGDTAAYEAQMKAALAMSDASRRNAAITRARQQLAQNSNKPLTAGAIAQLDSNLNIQGASPQLGASP